MAKKTLLKRLREMSSSVRLGLAAVGLMAGAQLSAAKAEDASDKSSAPIIQSAFQDGIDFARYFGRNDSVLREKIDVIAQTKTGRDLLLYAYQNRIAISHGAVSSYETGSYDPVMKAIRLKKTPTDLKTVLSLVHELEHARNLSSALAAGFRVNDFSSVDDRYTFETLTEALAERSSAQFLVELQKLNIPVDIPNEFKFRDFWEKCREGTLSENAADQVFHDRLTTSGMYKLETRHYYEQHHKRKYHYANLTSDLFGFSQDQKISVNPDWDQIISVMSLGQITKLEQYPVISPIILDEAIVEGVLQNQTLEEMDLTNFRANSIQNLKKDEAALRFVLMDHLAVLWNEAYYSKEESSIPLWSYFQNKTVTSICKKFEGLIGQDIGTPDGTSWRNPGQFRENLFNSLEGKDMVQMFQKTCALLEDKEISDFIRKKPELKEDVLALKYLNQIMQQDSSVSQKTISPATLKAVRESR